MKLVIELEQLTLAQGTEYTPTSYPADSGAWLVNGTNIAIKTGPLVYYMVNGIILTKKIDDAPQPAAGMLEAQACAALPLNLAEVLAVALHRDAAVAMMNKGGAS